MNREMLTRLIPLIDQAPSAMRGAPLRDALNRGVNSRALTEKPDMLLAEVTD